MPSFVLAHLSDPHIPPLPQGGFRDLFGKRALGFTNWLRKRRRLHRADLLARIAQDVRASAPDHIAVTGDLVNLSLPAEYAPARAWLESLGTAQDVTLVPGNHDAYVHAAATWPQLYWGDYMRSDAGEASFPFVRRRGPLALIGLSSAAASPSFWATGFLGPEQLARLAETLQQLGREGLFRVVLVHHPARSRPSRYFKRLVDGPALREVLAQHGAELVIHGHDHVHSLDWLDGGRGRMTNFGHRRALGIACARRRRRRSGRLQSLPDRANRARLGMRSRVTQRYGQRYAHGRTQTDGALAQQLSELRRRRFARARVMDSGSRSSRRSHWPKSAARDILHRQA
jgi:3',5'-cyclic AMP phosphodiesterase CpdA